MVYLHLTSYGNGVYLQLQVFSRDIDKDGLVLYAARASRTENQDAIDASIVGMLSNPQEVYKIDV